jgi:hypothetical protein
MAMSVVKEIIAARRCGFVHCGLSTEGSDSISELATEFGLSGDPKIYCEIDRQAARSLIYLVLEKDLAYGGGAMPRHEANRLTDAFLAQFDMTSRFYTNGTFHEVAAGNGATWSPATDATFDTGVLVLSDALSGCLWVEDED